jgi:uncharacterized coiled-coil protein SlyX
MPKLQNLMPLPVPTDLPFVTYQAACAVSEAIAALQPGISRALVLGLDVPLSGIRAFDAELTAGQLMPDAWQDAGKVSLPYADGEFGLVAACDVLDQIPGPVREPFLRELARVSSRYLLVLSPFGSDVVTAAEESVNEIHRATRGSIQVRIARHRDYGLPRLGAMKLALESATGGDAEVFPLTSLRSWALFEMLGCVAGVIDSGEVLLSRFNRFFNTRLARLDHSRPAYRHLLLSARGGRPVRQSAVRALSSTFAENPAEEEIQTVRDMLRLILDAYAEALPAAQEKRRAPGARQRIEELERKIDAQARIIKKLNDELAFLRKTNESKASQSLLKRLFTF